MVARRPLVLSSGSIAESADAQLLTELAAPSTPAANVLAVYAGTDHKLHTKDSTGADTALGSGGGSSKSYATRTAAVAAFR